jgi:hypothetical protein
MGDKIEVSLEVIINKIYLIRGQKVMLDRDLAALYLVETKQLKRQVRRNINRFPEDFMFELSDLEFEFLRSQIGTSSWGGTRYRPMAFTEHGVSMLSSVLNSEVAIEVNIQIIRTFTKMREMTFTSKELLVKLEKLEKQSDQQDESIEVIFRYLKELIKIDKQPKKQLGYKPNNT